MLVSRWRIAMLVVVALVAFVGCRPRPAPAPPPVVVTPTDAATLDALRAHLVQPYTPFTYTRDTWADSTAQQVAQVNARSGRCGVLTHSTPAQILAWFPAGGGENLFCWYVPSGCPSGDGAAATIAQAWINSPSHLAVMQQLNGYFYGVGAACANGTTLFAVAHFHF